MKAKKLLAVLLSVVMAFTLVACGNGGSSDTKGEGDSGGGNRVGIAMPTKSLERWSHDGSFLEKQFEDKGYDVELIYSDNNADQQVKDIEGLIEAGVDLLVIAPVESDSLSQVLTQAKEKNISVISYDRLIMNTDAVSYYVSYDNYTVGKMQGEFVRDKLKLDDQAGPFNIEFVAGDPADNNAGFIFNGAFDVLKNYIDAGKLVVQSGQTTFEQVATEQWDASKAMERFQSILASDYSGKRLDAVVCSNDALALGVAQAIESGYKGDKSKIIITGQDGDEANLANIIDGKQTMTVFKALTNEAKVTLDLGVEILSGKNPEEALIEDSLWDFECIYDGISYDNGAGGVSSYLLEPVVITKDNIQKELVDTGFYTMDDQGYPSPVE